MTISSQRASSVHVVIVNWNAGAQLKDCLESFQKIAADGVRLYEITIVDNASVDDSLEMISLSQALPVRVIRNPQNLGFGVACNQGAFGSQADYILFLNPDTQLQAGCLEIPVKFLNDPANQSVGIVGIQLIDREGHVSRNCARQPSALSIIGQSIGLDRLLPSIFPSHFLSEWPHDETREVFQVMGAFFLIRRSLFESLGGFDERFFVYYEDLDLALRAHACGAKSFFISDARAFHRGGGTSEQVKAERLFYIIRSRILFVIKHFGMVSGVLVGGAAIIFELPVRVVDAVFRGRRRDAAQVLRAAKMLWLALPEIIVGRRRSR